VSARSAAASSGRADRSFPLLLTALATSSVGDWLYNVALLAFVASRGGAGLLGVVTAARVLPIVIAGPAAGALTDRVNRRVLMIGSDLLRAALMAGLVLVAAAGLPLWLAPLLAALATLAGSAHPVCVSSTVPRLVEEADLPRANAARVAVSQTAIVLGPALGALLLAVSSPVVAFAVNGATFLVSAAITCAIGRAGAWRVPVDPQHRAPGAKQLTAGLRALRAAPEALRLAGADVACSAVYGTLTVLLVAVGMRITHSTGGYGLLLGGYGLGGVLGALLVGRIGVQWRRALPLAVLAVCAPLPLLGVVGSLAPALALALLAGAGMVVAEVLSETAIQSQVPESMLGQVFGLVIPTSLAGIVVGALAAGPLLALLGLEASLVVVAVAVMAVLAGLLGPVAAQGRRKLSRAASTRGLASQPSR
jgi:MFS family permease